MHRKRAGVKPLENWQLDLFRCALAPMSKPARPQRVTLSSVHQTVRAAIAAGVRSVPPKEKIVRHDDGPIWNLALKFIHRRRRWTLHASNESAFYRARSDAQITVPRRRLWTISAYLSTVPNFRICCAISFKGIRYLAGPFVDQRDQVNCQALRGD